MAVGDDALGLRYLRQRAIYWAPVGSDPAGEETFVDPIVVRCFWQDENQLFTDKKGNQVLSRSIVAVDRDLQLDGALGFLEKGKDIADFDPFPFNNPGVLRIQNFSKLPNRKCDKWWREAKL